VRQPGKPKHDTRGFKLAADGRMVITEVQEDAPTNTQSESPPTNTQSESPPTNTQSESPWSQFRCHV